MSKLTELYPGNGFVINGKGVVYEKYENDNCVVRDPKQKGRIFIYGFEGLRRIVRQYGYDLKKEEEP